MKISALGKVLVTGGTGFIGSYLVKRLIKEGLEVRVFDNNLRGNLGRLENHKTDFEYIDGDVCDYEQVHEATRNVDTVFHLAFINGTDNFYKRPDKVLEVGVKGAIHTLDAAMDLGVKNYIVTSSSEVYQEPTQIPTDESQRIIIPDINNPRFSYSGGKIITELMAIHYTIRSNMKVIVIRPHNFYGPDMGFGHVIPQFIMRMKKLSNNFCQKKIDFPIQGSGLESRAFCYIDDAVDGIMTGCLHGLSRELYHLGTEEEITIKELVYIIADKLGLEINLQNTELLKGGTSRRCPNISKIRALGYSPHYSLDDGINKTIGWYKNHSDIIETSALKGILK